MSESQGRKRSTKGKNTTMPPNFTTSTQAPTQDPVVYAPPNEQQQLSVPYPPNMYPHQIYYMQQQPYTFDNADYAHKYHIHSHAHVSAKPNTHASTDEEQSHTSHESADSNSSTERNPKGTWLAASITGATWSNLSGVYEGRTGHGAIPYTVALMPSGAAVHFPHQPDSIQAAMIGDKSNSNAALGSIKRFEDNIASTKPAALSGAADRSIKPMLQTNPTTFTFENNTDDTAKYRDTVTAFRGAAARSMRPVFEISEGHLMEQNVFETSESSGGRNIAAAALSGAADRLKTNPTTFTFDNYDMAKYRDRAAAAFSGAAARSMRPVFDRSEGHLMNPSVFETSETSGGRDIAAAALSGAADRLKTNPTTFTFDNYETTKYRDAATAFSGAAARSMRPVFDRSEGHLMNPSVFETSETSGGRDIAAAALSGAADRLKTNPTTFTFDNYETTKYRDAAAAFSGAAARSMRPGHLMKPSVFETSETSGGRDIAAAALSGAAAWSSHNKGKSGENFSAQESYANNYSKGIAVDTAAAFSGAVGPVPYEMANEPVSQSTRFRSGIYRDVSFSPSRVSNARLGLSFTTSSDQTSGRTASFSTTRTDSDYECQDEATGDIRSISGRYSETSELSESKLASVPGKDKRARKNHLARLRSSKVKEQIDVILSKPDTQVTTEEARLYHQYEAKRLLKNERSRNLAKGKKLKIIAIRDKPVNERSREEQLYLDRFMRAKFRKNEGDRLRRLRAKESSLASGDSSSNLLLHDESVSEGAAEQLISIEEPLSPGFRDAISFFTFQSPYSAHAASVTQTILPEGFQETLSSPDHALFYAISPIRNPSSSDNEHEARNK